MGGNVRVIHGHVIGGMSPTYSSWVKMWARCRGTNDKRYEKRKNYDLRGIRVCKRWLRFENFLADMGERPTGLTLDRKDNNKGYSPSNCRWATMKQQIRNRRNRRTLKAFGQEVTIAEWAEISGLGWNTIKRRIVRGWSAERAVTEAPHPNK